MKKAVSDFAASRYEPGSSRVWDSILRGISLFTSGRDTSNIVRALIFISDGRDTSSAITRELAGEIALEDDVQLFAVGVVDVYQEEDLAQMVESTGGVYYPTEALIALEEQLRLVISDLVGQYSVSYITLRRRGVYKVRVQVDLPTAKGEFETKALDMASFFGLDNVGRIAIDPLTVDRERAEVRTYARALHVPRNVNRFRFRLDTSKEISVGIIPAAEGGLLERWRLRIDPFGYYELSSATPLAFGKSGLLFGLTVSGVTEKNLEIPVEFDNDIYARGKSFTYPDNILVGERVVPGQIAFRTTRTGNSEIFVMNTDGSDQENITDHPEGDFLADWSPDGSQIAFDTNRSIGTAIFIMDRDGGNVRPLVNVPSHNVLPSWSPDGNRIVFDSTRDGNREIYIINVNGSGLTRITNNSASDWWARWSPDGGRVAFNTARDGNAEIYVMDANGANPVNLTNHPAGDFRPVWSPDGQRIAFYSSRDGNREIYVMNADGSGQRNLTNRRGDDWYPTWSPDGNRIAFTTFRDANREVYVMRSDGTQQRNLTNHPGDDWAPAWGR